MRALRTIMFILFSLIFGLIGAAAFYSHAQTHILRAKENANDVILNLKRIRAMAVSISNFRDENGRLPTSEEVSCNWKKCERYYPRVWRIVPTTNDEYELSYYSLGVPIAPVRQYWLTWNSSDGTSDYDHLIWPWQWHMWFVPKALLDLVVLFFPTLFLFFYRKIRPRFGKPNKSLNSDAQNSGAPVS